ncbi:hypothetical protein MMC08_004059 [Hypocenomyce scalaris]|nr:hypothetical protein [Hypocenomyce scalaris]
MVNLSLHDRIHNLPTYAELPRLPGLPKGCTWGLWDLDGSRDELGTLNLLTPETVQQAATEIREGISVSLNWALDKPNAPVFGRQGLSHTIIDNNTFSSSKSFDDAVSFNTQSGSQWDGLRHVINAEAGALYNGVSKGEVNGPEATGVLGIDRWLERGGVVGRGVLIDYVAYAQRHDISYLATTAHKISHLDLEQAAHEQGVTFKQGDILIVRSGVTKWYNECANTKERDDFFTNSDKQSVGVAPTDEAIAWVWDHHFSAVAGDALAWEPVPYPSDRPSFHQSLLPLWGTPIGELWDLEKLAETCARLKRYSFFLTSVPLNVPGGVASPPNAVAVF